MAKGKITLQNVLDLIPSKELVRVRYRCPDNKLLDVLKPSDRFDDYTMPSECVYKCLKSEHGDWLNADVTEVSIGMECAGDGFYAVEDERPYIDISVVY